MENQTPYANLHPDLILDAIESIGFRCSGNLFALNSYENRVYQVGIDEEAPIIAKFYRPHRWTDKAILEEHQFAMELAAQEIPVVAPLVNEGKTLHHFKNFRFALFPRKGGRAFELDNLDQLEWMGRFIGRVHAVGSTQPFQHRMQLDIKSHGQEPFQFLMNSPIIPTYVKDNFSYQVKEVLQKINTIFQRVGPIRYLRLHGDCHAGNILWNEGGPHIVDLDDCLMGPAIQDIWMLLSGNKDQVALQLDLILEGYREFHGFNPRELHLIEPLRTLRMLHYSAWLAKRWDDPAFPLNFPWFNSARYWEELIRNLHEQSNLLDEVLENLV